MSRPLALVLVVLLSLLLGTFVALLVTGWEWEGALVVLATCAGGVLGWLLASLHRARLQKLLDAVDEMAAGKEDVAIPGPGRDEIGALARSVRSLDHAYRLRIEALEEETMLLGSILRSMREGILLVGPGMRVEVWNEPLRSVLRPTVQTIAGRTLPELTPQEEILDAYRKVLEGSDLEERKFRTGGTDDRAIELRVVPMAGREGAVGLFLDVSRIEALEGVRQMFIANVSHELRTPLSSIKAFTETLLEGALEDPEHRVEFLEIVRRHTNRMQALIEDLTDLSMIETGATRLEMEELDLGEVACQVAEELEPRARERKIAVAVEVPRGLPVRADRRRIEQVLTNLLDNAVKFNREAGAVQVRGEKKDGRVVLRVEDTGPGIPPGDLEQVFHRFYRVDKARSRELGGTGLGLSIVKHLVRLHGGTVHAENRPEGGASFVVELPAA